MTTVKEVNLKAKLKEYFGYNQFRGNQEEIIKNLRSGRNTFVIMPTGAGKSLCYQLPAVIDEGTAIVISPLIALMKNQVDQLVALGINAQFLNSTLSKSEAERVKAQVLASEVKLLYVAPESLTKEETVEFLKKAKISFVAIDEAHCISEWGHDFRPEYRKIRSIIANIGNFPIIALTATATPKVQQDIQKNLNMEDADVFKSSFNRTNLFYEIKPKVNPKKQLIKFVKKNKGKSGIIYCLSRKKVEEIAEFLVVNDVKALPYHAGLDSHERMANQDAFLNEDADVIVATIAFGMGIDKPDVRFVIHYDTPKSLEGYYQETGRAGRDGLEGKCLMYFSHEDIHKLEKFNKDKSVTERDNAKHLLEEMAAYADSSVCRRRQLLHYFGEVLNKDCGFCDNCVSPREKFEGKEFMTLVLQAVTECDNRFGAEHIVDVLMGKETQYVKSYNHDQLNSFGAGDDQTQEFWMSIIRQAMLYQNLKKDAENVNALKVTKNGLKYLENPTSITLTKDHNYDNIDEDVDEDSKDFAKSGSHDSVLFDMLKSLRKKIAKQKGLPPYVIFQDPSLEEISTIYPTTMDDLAQINGVGMGKARKFGQPFIDLIAKYVEENDISTASDVIVKSPVNKSKIKIFIIQQIDRKIDLEDIAESKDITLLELIHEIEHICYSGTKLHLDYYINQVIDKDKQQELYDYFMEAETDEIQGAINEFGEDEYSEEEIRLMRIKFLSEVGL